MAGGQFDLQSFLKTVAGASEPAPAAYGSSSGPPPVRARPGPSPVRTERMGPRVYGGLLCDSAIVDHGVVSPHATVCTTPPQTDHPQRSIDDQRERSGIDAELGPTGMDVRALVHTTTVRRLAYPHRPSRPSGVGMPGGCCEWDGPSVGSERRLT